MKEKYKKLKSENESLKRTVKLLQELNCDLRSESRTRLDEILGYINKVTQKDIIITLLIGGYVIAAIIFCVLYIRQ